MPKSLSYLIFFDFLFYCFIKLGGFLLITFYRFFSFFFQFFTKLKRFLLINLIIKYSTYKILGCISWEEILSMNRRRLHARIM